MPKPTHAELAGKWEMIKDTAGKEKRGLCLAIYPIGPCLVSTSALLPSSDRPCLPATHATLCRESVSSALCPFSLLSGAARMSPAVRHLRRCRQRIHGQMLLPVHVRAILPHRERLIRQVERRSLRAVRDRAPGGWHHRRHDAGDLSEERWGSLFERDGTQCLKCQPAHADCRHLCSLLADGAEGTAGGAPSSNEMDR